MFSFVLSVVVVVGVVVVVVVVEYLYGAIKTKLTVLLGHT